MRKTLLLFAALPLLAQQPAFEVATIKQAPPIVIEDMISGKVRPGITVDAAQVTVRAVSLASIMMRAYRLQTYQLTAPDWMRTQPYFDIVAKIPEGGTPEQVPEMLQALLKERFKLEVHRETKDLPVYALVVGKNGPKLKPAPPGATLAFKMTQQPGGIFHFQTTSDLTAFAQTMITFVGRPVLDRTDLKGIYEIVLDVTRDAPRDNPGDLPGILSQGAEFVAAVEQLGLKLESRKEPTEMIVVDHAEKTPTEN
jgi:uncharacterized protein (TIGR03435 family)